jgi:hypothetical protein
MLSRHLAAAFAMAVSASTAQSAGWIARRGDESIHRIIELIFPQVIANVPLPCSKSAKSDHALPILQRGSVENSRGHRRITGSELNKFVQASCGFICARTRRKGPGGVRPRYAFLAIEHLNPLFQLLIHWADGHAILFNF